MERQCKNRKVFTWRLPVTNFLCFVGPKCCNANARWDYLIGIIFSKMIKYWFLGSQIVQKEWFWNFMHHNVLNIFNFPYCVSVLDHCQPLRFVWISHYPSPSADLSRLNDHPSESESYFLLKCLSSISLKYHTFNRIGNQTCNHRYHRKTLDLNRVSISGEDGPGIPRKTAQKIQGRKLCFIGLVSELRMARELEFDTCEIACLEVRCKNNIVVRGYVTSFWTECKNTLTLCNYCPLTKLGQGNIFSTVCHFVHRGGGLASQHA